MDPDDLVRQLGTAQRLDAMRALVGGVKATELRAANVTEPVFAAIVEGVSDPDAQVRWWCLQLLDHLDDERGIDAITDALDDSVPRVRRNAAHALGCHGCKPRWDGVLPDRAVQRLTTMAENDPNAKVRAQAQASLQCTASSRAQVEPTRTGTSIGS